MLLLELLVILQQLQPDRVIRQTLQRKQDALDRTERPRASNMKVRMSQLSQPTI